MKRSTKYNRAVIIFGLSLAILIPPVKAQSPHPQEPRAQTTIRLDTDLVTVEVTATDRAGNYVRDLRAEDFKILEDGRPQKIDFFAMADEAVLSRPLAVVFALDISGSIKPDETVTLRQAAAKFTALMNGASVFAALAFNQEVKIYQDFTADQRKIERAFERMDQFGGSTRIYDALDRAIMMLSRRTAHARGRCPRRVVIVITDGFDSSSVIDRRELVRRACAAGATIYSITLPSYMFSPTQVVARVMTPLEATSIVEQTGGRDFPADARDFTPVFKALAEEIRSSYALSYYPQVRDGQYHALQVTTLRAGVQLRANRTGYLAPQK